MVALRKESVDRNYYCDHDTDWIRAVALRKESVDRNCCRTFVLGGWGRSLSARRAWIEIRTRSQPSKPRTVALRKESVDRNISALASYSIIVKSLSARRAWIEMTQCRL